MLLNLANGDMLSLQQATTPDWLKMVDMATINTTFSKTFPIVVFPLLKNILLEGSGEEDSPYDEGIAGDLVYTGSGEVGILL